MDDPFGRTGDYRGWMNLRELREWMAERGHSFSYQEWTRRARAGRIGCKIGRDYIVSPGDRDRVLREEESRSSS